MKNTGNRQSGLLCQVVKFSRISALTAGYDQHEILYFTSHGRITAT